MADWRWCFVALVLGCATVFGGETAPPTVKPDVKVTDKITDTPASISTVLPDTTAPETTTVPPQTTTPPPTTPPPTTPPPTTPPPKTTTPPPKTTTPPPKTTTPAPAPTPAPTTGTWNFTDAKNNTCIVVQFALQFNVSYAAGKETKIVRFNLPNDSLVTNGNCGNDTDMLTLSWPKEVDAMKQNNFTLVYMMNSTSQQYYISKVTLDLVYDAKIFPDASSTSNMKLQMKSKVWPTSAKHSYRCKMAQSLKLTTDGDATNGNLVAELIMSDVQEEAFRTAKGHQFSTAADCQPADVPDVVPIAVGCALGGLVLVVLVAYIVGRRRAANPAYVSM